MSKLFIKQPEFEKVSYYRLSENPSDWTGQIMEQFYSQYPFFANTPVTVTLTQKDETKGYAIGNINVEGGVPVSVPIIIRSRELFPFDVCIVNGKTMPLSDTILNMYVQGRGAFLKVVKPEAGDITNALFNSSFSQQITPTYMNESYKQASLREDSLTLFLKNQLGGAIKENAIVDALQKKALLGGQPQADQFFLELKQKYTMAKSNSLQYMMLIFKKWAIDQGFETNHWDIPDTNESAETSVHETIELGKSASLLDRILPTITQEMKDEFFDDLKKDASIVEGFRRNGTGSVILKIASAKPEQVNFKDIVRKDLERDLRYIYKNAAYEWKAILGSSRVIDPVEVTITENDAHKLESVETSINYEGEIEKTAGIEFAYTANNRSFVIFEDSTFAELPPQAYTATQEMEKKANFNRIVSEKPEITKYAIWVIPGQGCTEPFEVTKVWNDNGKEMVETWNGVKQASYRTMLGIDSTYTDELDSMHPIIYITPAAKFVKLANRVELPEKDIDIYLNGNRVSRMDHNTYVLQGKDFNELTKISSYQCDINKACWNTLQLGGTKMDLMKIAELKTGHSYTIPHILKVPLEFEKVAQKMSSENAKSSKRITEIAKNFIKEASVLTNIPTVDAVLALNFVNKSNISEFASYTDNLLETANVLATMLVKTRLGAQIVDEVALRRVMLGLVEIIEVLQGISNLAGRK
jgi:hypothetical protein